MSSCRRRQALRSAFAGWMAWADRLSELRAVVAGRLQVRLTPLQSVKVAFIEHEPSGPITSPRHQFRPFRFTTKTDKEATPLLPTMEVPHRTKLMGMLNPVSSFAEQKLEDTVNNKTRLFYQLT